VTTSNGEWSEMKRLVLAKMDDHSKRLEEIHLDVSRLQTKVAIICDRGDRDLIAARSVAMRWATYVGAFVSAIVSGVIGVIRGQ
jgi:hypothetical protein